MRWIASLIGLLLLLQPTFAHGQTPCVDLNTASHQELQRIVHIGAARAEQILQLRAQRPFASVEEITRVSGIAAARAGEIVGRASPALRVRCRQRQCPRLRHPQREPPLPPPPAAAAESAVQGRRVGTAASRGA